LLADTYEQGLSDAWECAKNIVCQKVNLVQIFDKQLGDSTISILQDYSASEAIAKIKEYEEKQKLSERTCNNCGHIIDNKRTCEICKAGGICDNYSAWIPGQDDKTFKVGDEVYLKDNKEFKLVIMGFNRDNLADAINSQGLIYTVTLDNYKKTGRTFPQIAEILEQMKE